MLSTTKARLTILFTLGITFFSVLVLSIAYFYLHESILDTLKDDIVEDGREEFIDHYRANDFAGFSEIDEDEVLQIFDNQGHLIAQTKNSKYFTPKLNLSAALKVDQDNRLFEVIAFNEVRHLVHYFRLDKQYIGRVAEPITQVIAYENRFLRLVLLSSPGILLLSFILGRVLVHLAMAPITEAFRFQENFSSNVTHELHSPLTSLKGNLEVALRKQRKPEDYREFIELGLKETNRVIALLQDLYLLASSNFKNLSLMKEQVPLAELVAEIHLELKPRLDAKSLSLEFDQGQDLEVFCDPGLFARALGNLLDNAVKYSVEGSVIELSAEKDGSYTRLVCSNQSKATTGMNAEDLLTPFSRGRNSEAFQASGKGLGLNIINYIVLSHQGKFKLSLDPNGRFSAKLTLPRSGKSLQIISL